MKKAFTLFSFALLGFSLYLIFFCGTEEKQMQARPVSISTPAAYNHKPKSQNTQAADQKEDSPAAVQAFGIR